MKQREDSIVFFLGTAIPLALIFVVVGGTIGHYIERQSAIDANVAEWRVNPKTGKTTFVYLTPATKPAQEDK